jgi:hypothetical protein
MRGNALLSGNLFCGHCGGKMTLSTARYHGKARNNVIYVCYQKNRALNDCDGQTTYTAKKLDAVVEEIVLNVFNQFRELLKAKVIEKTHKKNLAEVQAVIKKTNAHIAKLEKQIQAYQAEVIKVITGESAFSSEVLNGVIVSAQEELAQHQLIASVQQKEHDELTESINRLEDSFNEILSWADIFSTADLATKKMICNHIIDRIEIRRGYDLTVTLSISVEQFGITVDTVRLIA